MEVQVEKSSGVPLYVQVSQILKEKIESGDLPEGKLLPSIKELANIFGVSTITVRQSLDTLANAGFISSTQGRGTYVAKQGLFEIDAQKKVKSILYLEHRGVRVGRGMREWESYSIDIKKEVEHVLRRAGLAVYHGPLDSEYLKVFLSQHAKNASAIILSASYSYIAEFAEQYKLPIIMHGEAPERLTGTYAKDVVNEGDYQGIVEMVNYLFSLGHRRIATIHGPVDTFGGVRRLDAYKDALIAHDIELNPDYIVDGYWEIAGGSECAERLMSLATPPTAIVCANDYMALGAMSYFTKTGINVPNDVSITGFDDISMSEYATPRLTTMSVDRVLLGTTIAQLVLERISNPDKPFTVMEFKPLIRIRESCKPIIS